MEITAVKLLYIKRQQLRKLISYELISAKKNIWQELIAQDFLSIILLVPLAYISKHPSKENLIKKTISLHKENLTKKKPISLRSTKKNLNLMALRSKKIQVLVAVTLLMALLVAAVSAGGSGDNKCTRVGACSDTLCTESYCSKHQTGSCRISGLFVYCCCTPVHATGSNVVRKLGH